ncbi:MAG: beta-N-acetylhexosaminidase [Bacteroidales bacterium]|nr:beta-N-acetylhexosaminidase [Bacteroidales bacterium]
MKSNSRFSRRSFLSGVTAAGVGSALSAFQLQEITDLANDYGEQNSTEVSENKSNNILLKRLIPQPEYVHLNDDNEVKLDNTLKVNIELGDPDAQAKSKTSDIFKRYFGADPVVSVIQKSDMPTGDAYKIRASGSTLTISAAYFTGIRYAFSTLRQLAEANNETEILVYYRIPETEIEDAPAMSFRGLHLCWFPETETIQIEQYLRWAAYYKFNYVIIEFWSTFPFISHPVLSWQEYKASPKDIRRLVDIGKELGITLVPQLNIFGHASGSRGGSGKHTILDLHPEYQPLFEPDGWVWCLSNPATRKVLSDIVLETLEAFDNPPYYHIGADEAWGAAECSSCRHSDYEALVLDHLNFFHKLLAEKNCRMMMWHDMLIQRIDPRWKGYVSNGSANAERMVNALPKDIIICDWQYGAPKKDETWPTMTFFKEHGFKVLACPWNNIENIKSLGKKVGDARLDGLLCTTWHAPSLNQLLNIMMYGSQAVWSKPPYAACDGMMGMRHLRQIGWDIPIKNYQNCGIHEWQVRPEIYP